MAQNVKKVASKNLKKPKVAENSKSCQNSKKLPKISKVAEKLPSNLWLSLLHLISKEEYKPLQVVTDFAYAPRDRRSSLQVYVCM